MVKGVLAPSIHKKELLPYYLCLLSIVDSKKACVLSGLSHFYIGV